VGVCQCGCTHARWRGQTSVDRSDSDSFPLGGQIVGSPPATGMTVGWGPSRAGRDRRRPEHTTVPPPEHRGPKLADVAAALQADRRGGRDGGGPESLSGCGCRDRDSAGAMHTQSPGAPRSPREPWSPWVSRDRRCGQRGAPDREAPRPHPCARAPSARRCRSQTRYRPLGWPPGQQALAGGWEGTWAHFLPRSFLPRKK